MKKFVAAMALFTLLVTSGYVGLIAQGKKSGEKSSSAKTGTIEIVESKDGKYRISIRNAEEVSGGLDAPITTARKLSEATRKNNS